MPPLAIAAVAAAAVAAGATIYATERNRAANKKKGPVGTPEFANTGSSGLGHAADKREGMGDDAQGRDYVHLDNTLGDQSRAQQEDALALMRQAALGQTPSVAQLQMRQGLDQSVRNQAALQSSARGMSALALAQQNAGVNVAMLNQQTAAQTGILRAQEMDAARGAYGGMATGIRGLDEGRSATQAQLEANQRGLNDQYQLGMYGQSAGLMQSEVDARTQANAQALQVWAAQNGVKLTEQQMQQARSQQDFNNALGAANGAFQAGAAVAGSGNGGQQQQQGQQGQQPQPSTGGTGMMGSDWNHDPT